MCRNSKLYIKQCGCNQKDILVHTSIQTNVLLNDGKAFFSVMCLCSVYITTLKSKSRYIINDFEKNSPHT